MRSIISHLVRRHLLVLLAVVRQALPAQFLRLVRLALVAVLGIKAAVAVGRAAEPHQAVGRLQQQLQLNVVLVAVVPQLVRTRQALELL